MPRPRRNDPLGTSGEPRISSDPVRIEELRQEFHRRLEYIADSYRVARERVGSRREFNASLARLRRAVNAKRTRQGPLELAISHMVRKNAAERTGAPDARVIQVDIDAAAKFVVSRIKPQRGRPEDDLLRHHVEGLMALLQEMSGKPVRATRYKDNDYDPQLCDDFSEILVKFFSIVDPSVTWTTLTNYVLKARRKYAGEQMRFRDFFPLYGRSLNQEDGSFSFEPNFPIYCP